jgi:hypothetical protein
VYSVLRPILLSLPAWLLAGAAFCVVVATAARRRGLAVIAALRGLIALLAFAAAVFLGGTTGGWVRPVSVTLSVLGTALVVAVALRVHLKRRRRRPADETPADLVWAWWWLAAMDLAALPPMLLSEALQAPHGYLAALPALLGIPAGLAVAAWYFARTLSRAERRMRAALAQGLALLYAGLPIALLAAMEMRDPSLAERVTVAFLLLAVTAPVAALCLRGLRPPRPIASAGQPNPVLDLARLEKRALLVGGLAVASLAWAVFLHLDRCDGELVAEDRLPDSWPATPVVAKSRDAGGVGPFRLQGIHHWYTDCGSFRLHHFDRLVRYSSRVALYDPLLCFSGGIRLDSKLTDQVDFALHQDEASRVFVLSGENDPGEPERHPIVAFRRQLRSHWRFDPPSSAWFCGMAALALLAALGLRGLARARTRPEAGVDRATPLVRWQIRLLLLSLALPWMLEAHRALIGAPTPAHDTRIHTVCRGSPGGI